MRKEIKTLVFGLIVGLCVLSGVAFGQSSCTSTLAAPCAFPSQVPFVQSDNKQMFDAIRSIGTVTSGGGTSSVVVTNTVPVTGTVSITSGSLNVNVTNTVPVTGTVSITSPQFTLTPTRVQASVSTTISAGFRSVTIETSSNFVGSILGTTVDPSTSYTYSTDQLNNVMGAINIAVTTGSVYINKTQ